MKKFRIALLALLLTSFSNLTWAQLDVSINPLAAILALNPKANVEFGINEVIGIELNGTINTNTSIAGISLGSGFTVGTIGKYYFNPDQARSGFYVGPYFRYIQYKPLDDLGSNLSTFKRGKAGVFAGYKIVSSKKILFEFGLGAGSRVFTNLDDTINLPSFDFTGKIAIGYRIDTKGGGGSSPSSRGNSSKDEMETGKTIDDRRKTTSRKKGKKKKGKKQRT